MNLSNLKPNQPFAVAAKNGMPATFHVFEQQHIDAIRTAWFAKRPLLVRGEPGLGKSQIAQALAHIANCNLLLHVVHSRSEPEDLLYRVDHVSRLAQAQLVSNKVADKTSVDIDKFVVPGPLWWAYAPEKAKAFYDSSEHYKSSLEFDTAKPTVLLIDEIDKSDSELPNSLLEVLNNQSFHAHGHDKAIQGNAKNPPFVVITTNEQRKLPHAFLRRCVTLTLSLESEDQLIGIAEAHKESLAALSDELIQRVASTVIKARANIADGDYQPGTSEFLDLLRVLNNNEFYKNDDDRYQALYTISQFVLDKA